MHRKLNRHKVIDRIQPIYQPHISVAKGTVPSFLFPTMKIYGMCATGCSAQQRQGDWFIFLVSLCAMANNSFLNRLTINYIIPRRTTRTRKRIQITTQITNEMHSRVSCNFYALRFVVNFWAKISLVWNLRGLLCFFSFEIWINACSEPWRNSNIGHICKLIHIILGVLLFQRDIVRYQLTKCKMNWTLFSANGSFFVQSEKTHQHSRTPHTGEKEIHTRCCDRNDFVRRVFCGFTPSLLLESWLSLWPALALAAYSFSLGFVEIAKCVLLFYDSRNFQQNLNIECTALSVNILWHKYIWYFKKGVIRI